MRLKEFITERGRNGSNEFDADPNAKPAETPDWLKKVGKYLGDKIGLKEPVALPDYTASDQQDAAAKSNYRGIDPIQRQSLGMAPATQQEIDAYMKANPAVVGGLTDRNGNPIASGNEVERAARAAAPRRSADFDVDSYAGAPDAKAVGDRFYTPRELGFQPGGTMPAEKKAAAVPAAVVPAPAAPAAPVAAAAPAAPAAPAAAAPAAAAPAAAVPAAPLRAAAPAAAAPAAAAVPAAPLRADPIPDVAAGPKLNRLTGKIDGENTEQDDAALARIKDLSQDPKLDTSKAKSGDQTVNIGGKSGDADADVGPVVEPNKDQKKKPSDTKSSVNRGINISPTVFAYATNIGLIQNGKLDIERIKKFQRSQNIEDDGIIGKDTSNAILSVGNAYQGAGTGRGDSGNPGGTPINVDEPKRIGYVESLPGVKDSKGRQVWRKNDGVLAGFDPYEHKMYRIGNDHKLMRDPYAGDFILVNPIKAADRPKPIGKTNEGLTIYRYANGRFGAWDADNRKMIPIDAPASQATVAKESSDMQRMRLLAGLTGK